MELSRYSDSIVQGCSHFLVENTPIMIYTQYVLYSDRDPIEDWSKPGHSASIDFLLCGDSVIRIAKKLERFRCPYDQTQLDIEKSISSIPLFTFTSPTLHS